MPELGLHACCVSAEVRRSDSVDLTFNCQLSLMQPLTFNRQEILI